MKRRKFFQTFAKAAVIALAAPEIVRSAMDIASTRWIPVLTEHQMQILESDEPLTLYWGRRDPYYVKYMEILHRENPHYAEFGDVTA